MHEGSQGEDQAFRLNSVYDPVNMNVLFDMYKK
jgi:hypothetical protein